MGSDVAREDVGGMHEAASHGEDERASEERALGVGALPEETREPSDGDRGVEAKGEGEPDGQVCAEDPDAGAASMPASAHPRVRAKDGVRAKRILELACAIVRKEQELVLMRASFERLVNQPEVMPPKPPSFPVCRPDGRQRRVVPLKQTILDAFGADIELPAGEVVHRLRHLQGCTVETIHTLLSKMTRDGQLRRVRWGVYAKT